MEHVTFSEFDTSDEKLKVINCIIDNQNQLEGKLLQLIAEKTPKKKVKKPSKKKAKKKGGK